MTPADYRGDSFSGKAASQLLPDQALARDRLRRILLATMLPAFGGPEIPWLPLIE